MKIGIYDPYLDTMGGGEWYILSIAACLASEHAVNIFWDDQEVLKKAKERFSLNTQNLSVSPNIFSTKIALFKKIKTMQSYDLLLFVSDGSIPWLFAKKNILLFQFPVNWVKVGIVTKIKLSKIDSIICYSDFVKRYLDKKFHKNALVLAPSLAIEKKKKSRKENIILSVGRFTKAMNAKKQEVLIQAFKELVDGGLKDWQLVLIGGVLPEDSDFVEDLRKQAKNYPITILANSTYATLQDWYGKAKIYWHGAGFGEDVTKNPERAEHFGITTVEAMANGAVPIVIHAGGQVEIVKNGENGFLWKDLFELEEKTMKVIKNNKLWKTLSQNAQTRAGDFSQGKFCQNVQKIFTP